MSNKILLKHYVFIRASNLEGLQLNCVINYEMFTKRFKRPKHRTTPKPWVIFTLRVNSENLRKLSKTYATTLLKQNLLKLTNLYYKRIK